MERKPKTVDEAVEVLIVEVSEEDRKKVAALDRNRLNDLHFSLGMFIRNRFDLHAANDELIKSFRQRYDAEHYPSAPGYFPYHPDEASSIIIQAFWERLQR